MNLHYVNKYPLYIKDDLVRSISILYKQLTTSFLVHTHGQIPFCQQYSVQSSYLE